MPFTDLTLSELHDYRPEVAEPDDFDRFWADTLAEARDAVAPLPVVVEYLGYGGGRGLPEDRLRWAASGYAHLAMDTRGRCSPPSTTSRPMTANSSCTPTTAARPARVTSGSGRLPGSRRGSDGLATSRGTWLTKLTFHV
jgi:cephalosporin-C deacetylase-like acetyl esterase